MPPAETAKKGRQSHAKVSRQLQKSTPEKHTHQTLLDQGRRRHHVSDDTLPHVRVLLALDLSTFVSGYMGDDR